MISRRLCAAACATLLALAACTGPGQEVNSATRTLPSATSGMPAPEIVTSAPTGAPAGPGRTDRSTAEAPTAASVRTVTATVPSGTTVTNLSPAVTTVGAAALPLPLCRADKLTTYAAGSLTIATPGIRLPPWFDGDPAASRGFEAAVGSAVAATLGFRPDQVVWTTSAATPGVPAGGSGFDVELGQFVIPPEGARAYDMSTGYYDISESAVAPAGSPAAAVRTVAQLRTIRLGVVQGTAGPDAVSEVVRPAQPAVSFPSVPAAVTALSRGDIGALVLTTPEVFDVTRGTAGLAILGQLPPGKWQSDQFGMVLSKGSTLTACISAAVDALRVEGDLVKLATTWISEQGDPQLR